MRMRGIVVLDEVDTVPPDRGELRSGERERVAAAQQERVLAEVRHRRELEVRRRRRPLHPEHLGDHLYTPAVAFPVEHGEQQVDAVGGGDHVRGAQAAALPGQLARAVGVEVDEGGADARRWPWRAGVVAEVVRVEVPVPDGEVEEAAVERRAVDPVHRRLALRRPGGVAGAPEEERLPLARDAEGLACDRHPPRRGSGGEGVAGEEAQRGEPRAGQRWHRDLRPGDGLPEDEPRRGARRVRQGEPPARRAAAVREPRRRRVAEAGDDPLAAAMGEPEGVVLADGADNARRLVAGHDPWPGGSQGGRGGAPMGANLVDVEHVGVVAQAAGNLTEQICRQGGPAAIAGATVHPFA